MTSISSVHCIGISHKTAPVSLRERVYVPETELDGLLPRLTSQFEELGECMVLSTCNRFEIYAVSTNGSILEELMLFLHGSRLSSKELSRILSDHTYILQGAEAVRHMFMVASSLDSLVIGETQIVGQYKKALQQAERCQLSGRLLRRLGQESLAVSKKIRHQTPIGEKTVSLSHCAVELARHIFGELKNQRFLVIGAGEMARVAATYASRFKPEALTVANRTLTNAQALVEDIPGAHAVPLVGIEKLISQHDIVIVATGSRDALITPDDLRRLPAKMTALVDISIPRNIHPDCARFDEVYLFTIDDIQQVVDDNLDERHASGRAAETLIDVATERTQNWIAQFRTQPVISSFQSYCRSLSEKEWKRTKKRQVMASLSNEQQRAIESMLTSLVGKMTADVAQSLKTGDKETQWSLSDAVAQVFTENDMEDQTAPVISLAGKESQSGSK